MALGMLSMWIVYQSACLSVCLFLDATGHQTLLTGASGCSVLLYQLKRNGADGPLTKASETLSQNKPHFKLSQVLCHIVGNRTNTSTDTFIVSQGPEAKSTPFLASHWSYDLATAKLLSFTSKVPPTSWKEESLSPFPGLSMLALKHFLFGRPLGYLNQSSLLWVLRPRTRTHS